MQTFIDVFTLFLSIPPMKMAKFLFYLFVAAGSLELFVEWVDFRIAKSREAEDM